MQQLTFDPNTEKKGEPGCHNVRERMDETDRMWYIAYAYVFRTNGVASVHLSLEPHH